MIFLFIAVAVPEEVKGQTTRSTRATRQNGRAEPPVPVVAPPPAVVPVVPEYVPEPPPSSRQTFPQQLAAGMSQQVIGRSSSKQNNINISVLIFYCNESFILIMYWRVG